MTPGEVTQIDHLRQALDDLTATIKRRNAWRRVLAVLAAIAIGILLASTIANRATLGIVRDATDPNGKLATRGQDGQALLLASLLDDGDCRHRRAAAGLPPPPLAYVPCRAQTPPEVYAGPDLTPPTTRPPIKSRAG